MLTVHQIREGGQRLMNLNWTSLCGNIAPREPNYAPVLKSNVIMQGCNELEAVHYHAL